MRAQFPSKEQIDEMVAEGAKAIAARRSRGYDPNSALLWYPPLLAAGLPVPRTEFVMYEPKSLWPLLDGGEPDGFPMDELKAAAEKIGYPIFVRTDLSSAKHDGPEAYRADGPDDLGRCIGRTFDDNACKDIVDFTFAWMVREWIDIDATFTAFRGLPIGREWRFFVDQDGVQCHHFYWPKDAVAGSWSKPEEWEGKLAMLSAALDANTLANLSAMALLAARSIGEHVWSVDFAQDKSGKWWLIDCAREEHSWHPAHD